MSKEYYKFKDGTQCPLTKKEIYKTIDVYNYKTVLKWCEYFDIPFYQKYWNQYVSGAKRKNEMPISKFVFGRYLGCMKLCGFRKFGFKDSWRFEQYENNINEFKENA